MRHAAVLALAAGLVWTPTLAGADPAASPGPIAPDARAIIDRMASLIQKATSISVVADLAWDTLQADGRKLEFGETRRIALRRPDRLRIDVERRTGEKRGLVYDGKNFALFDYDENVYAEVPKTGTTDAVIDYAQGDLGIRFPLAELLSSDLAKTLGEQIREASFIEVERIDGVSCDHVAFRTDVVDAQLWIAQGDAPLVRRIVLAYRNELGQPQFRAQLRDWNLAASLPDSLFVIAPSEGSERLPFMPKPGTPEAGK